MVDRNGDLFLRPSLDRNLFKPICSTMAAESKSTLVDNPCASQETCGISCFDFEGPTFNVLQIKDGWGWHKWDAHKWANCKMTDISGEFLHERCVNVSYVVHPSFTVTNAGYIVASIGV